MSKEMELVAEFESGVDEGFEAVAARIGQPERHEWNDEFCSCGQDAVTCQGCGRRYCGSLTVWVKGRGNLCMMGCTLFVGAE